MVFGYKLSPNIKRFAVAWHVFGFAAFKNRYIKAVFGQFSYFGQKLPRPLYGFFFKIIAKTPVAQHLEHGVVIRIYAHFFEVVVLARHPHTLLRVGNTRGCWRGITQKKVLKLVHTCVVKHQGRVVFYYYGCR